MVGLHSLGGSAPEESSFVLDWIHRFGSSTYTKWEKMMHSDKSPLLQFNENGLKFEAIIDNKLLAQDQLSQVD